MANQKKILKITLHFEEGGEVKTKTVNLAKGTVHPGNPCGPLPSMCIEGKLYCMQDSIIGPIPIPTNIDC